MQIEWNKIDNVIVEAVKDSLGEKKGKTNEEWFDEECRTARSEKNYMRKIKLQRLTSSSKETYREHRRRANKICLERKRKMPKGQIESVEVDRERTDTRKDFGKDFKPA